MKDQKYIKKGRTGREGITLKSYGILGTAVGLLWALLAFILAEGYGAMTIPICILVMGGLLLWVGHSIGRANSRIQATD